jgi:hypothetical protein
VAWTLSRENSQRARAWRVVVLALAGLALVSCGGGGGDSSGPVQIRTLSNRADLVSDGDVLVEVVAPAGGNLDGLKVTVNGSDVTSAFSRFNGRMIGQLTGLATGDNVVTANVTGAPGSRLVVTNAPRSGPVLSGPQTTPFFCATPTPQPASGSTPATNGSGLSGQPDANCGIAAEFKLYYRTTAAAGGGTGQCSTALLPDPVWNSDGVTGTIPAQPAAPANPCWKPFTEGSTPGDMATTTTADGVTVPFVVRLERGTMNRGIYDIAVLFRPGQPWLPTAPQAAWNQKIYYAFGSSTGQPRRQSRTTINWTTLEEQLKRGYLVAQNSMTDSSRNSNRALMSETTMMMKEHIIDTYGPVKYTLGTGCSGGSINANMNLSIMPGVLDGVITTCTYPDSESTALEVGDCTLLVEAYRKPALLNVWSILGLTQEAINARKAAINGHQDQTGCQAWFNLFGSNGKAGVYNPRQVLAADQATGAITQFGPTNNCELPNDAVYDPAHPTSTLPRCNAWSWAEAVWGRVPGSVAARDTRDNVGVQYGLRAFLAGQITAEEFVTLNEAIGGIDRDSTPRAQRSSADSEALAIAYRAGIVASGANLAKAAIIDLRGWDDAIAPGALPPGAVAPFGIHHQWFSWAIRDRIARDFGDAANQALWRFARGNVAVPPANTAIEALEDMDQWLTAVKADTGSNSLELKVRAARPAATADFCIPASDATQTTRIRDMAQCDLQPFLKPGASPRQVAGGPRSEDVLKCQLKPLALADYPAGALGTAQFNRLGLVFPSGVCDFSKPGVGQQTAVSPLTFKDGPGGQPLGDAPASTRQ